MERQPAPTCVRIERSPLYRGKQGLEYFSLAFRPRIPPMARATPHLHEAGMWYGENLREHMWLHAGDFLYIPANMPHLPYNASDSVPCVGLIARTDPNEQESVTLLPLADPGVAAR